MDSGLHLTSITIGAPKPRELAMFYARLLGGEITADDPPRENEPADAGWAQVRVDDDARRFTLNFEYEAEWRTPVWPSEAGKQHITQHLDILVDDLESATAWAEKCGATRDPFQPQSAVVVMRDPAGHPFCLFVNEEEE